MSREHGKRSLLEVLLHLGRVSNLPTVWSNLLAASVLAGLNPNEMPALAPLLAMSAFYVGGMYLNDAFDREIDARERPTRPIPSGQISAAMVIGIGGALMLGGLVLILPYGSKAVLSACALVAAIVLYDIWHKGNPFSPVMMGLCRALVYLTAAATASPAAAASNGWCWPVLLGAAAVMAHVIGLTYAAKQESLDRIGRLWPLVILALPLVLFGLPALRRLPDVLQALTQLPAQSLYARILTGLILPALIAVDVLAVRLLAARRERGDVPKAVAQLIAAISLLDGVAILVQGGPVWAVAACIAAYCLTRLFQRVIPGT